MTRVGNELMIFGGLGARSRFTDSVPPLTDSPIHRGRRRSPIHRFTNSPRALPLTDSPIHRGNPFTDAPCTANAGAHEGR